MVLGKSGLKMGLLRTLKAYSTLKLGRLSETVKKERFESFYRV
jgi:hypothetical protein